MRSAGSNARILRNRVRKPAPASRGRIKITVPNARSGPQIRRGKIVAEPKYQFRKYLEAMKESSAVETIAAKQTVSRPPVLSRVVAKSTQTFNAEPYEAEDDSQIVEDMKMDEDEPVVIEDGIERRVKLMKTVLPVARATSTKKTPKPRKPTVATAIPSSSRKVKGRQVKGDDNIAPAARLFWKSFT